MLILGVDPGLNNTGWAVVRKSGSLIDYIKSGVIKTSPKEKLANRLLIINQAVQQIIKLYCPNQFAIEETFVNKNPLSSLMLGQARAASILAAASANLEVYEYASKFVKKTITGNGSAEKSQVGFMVKILAPKASLNSSDESDALAVAITHSNFCK